MEQKQGIEGSLPESQWATAVNFQGRYAVLCSFLARRLGAQDYNLALRRDSWKSWALAVLGVRVGLE